MIPTLPEHTSGSTSTHMSQRQISRRPLVQEPTHRIPPSPRLTIAESLNLVLQRTNQPQGSISAQLETELNSENDTEPSTEITPTLRRHSDLWFDDGSIILRADDTLFKVHISQLARHSAFFKDMFSLPQPDQGCVHPDLPIQMKGTENLPVIYLHDKAEDVGNLLTALYDGPSVFMFTMPLIVH